jgi:hypothetical protein
MCMLERILRLLSVQLARINAGYSIFNRNVRSAAEQDSNDTDEMLDQQLEADLDRTYNDYLSKKVCGSLMPALIWTICVQLCGARASIPCLTINRVASLPFVEA